MLKFIFVFLLFSISRISADCPAGYTFSSDFNKCYRVVEVLADYFNAQRLCSLDGAQLTSIINGINNGYVAGLSPEHLGISHWIGLTRLINDSWIWMDNTSSNYLNWASGQPDSANKCAAIRDSSNLWESRDCSTQLPFICIFDPTVTHGCPTCPTPSPSPTQQPTTCPTPSTTTPGSCPIRCDEGWNYLAKTNSCYRTYFNKNYDNAEQYCNTLNAHLVSIHSDEENQFVIDMSKTGINDQDDHLQVVIGLKRDCNNCPFKWSDGSLVGDYNAWGPKEPSDNNKYLCTELFADTYHGTRGQWENEWCTWECSTTWRAFVCKKPANY